MNISSSFKLFYKSIQNTTILDNELQIRKELRIFNNNSSTNSHVHLKSK